MSEENKTHNQMIILSPRSKFLDEMVISDGVLPNATVILPQCSSLIFYDPLLLEVLLHYIVLLYSIPPSTCLLSSFELEFSVSLPTAF